MHVIGASVGRTPRAVPQWAQNFRALRVQGSRRTTNTQRHVQQPMPPRRAVPLLLGSGILLTLGLTRSRWWSLLRDLLHYLQSKLHGLPQRDQDDSKESADILDLPECRPLRTVAALLQWQPPPRLDSPSITPLQRQQAFCAAAGAAVQGVAWSPDAATSSRPRLLVCHDYKHGYKADRWVQGSTDPEAFRMWRWECVDIFCYFSHELVTLPPPAWVAAAHTHGTLVLGTFIAEWGLGRWRCEQLFASPATAQKAAEQLARLASCYGFDGWLINIENGLSKALLPNLQHFLCHLRALLRSTCGPQAMLVWYDAITTDGVLRWQNHVTQSNQPFMDACDAIYLNYAWNAATPYEVSVRAAGRTTDVYLGIDVWGRGTYGGGQDKCNIALQASLKHGVSTALFAPGWLYEAFPLDGFTERSDAWWDKVSAAWPTRSIQHFQGLSGFVTHFCGGAGTAGFWVQGHKVSDQPWHNMALQQRRPTPCWLQLLASSGHQHSQGQAQPQQEQQEVPMHHEQQQGYHQQQQGYQQNMIQQQQQHQQEDQGWQQPTSQWRCSNANDIAFTGGSCLLAEGPAASLQQGPVLCQLYSTCLPVVTGQGLAVGFAQCSADGYQLHAPSQLTAAAHHAAWAVAPVLWVKHKLPPATAAIVTAAATNDEVHRGMCSSALVLLPDGANGAHVLQQAGLQVIQCATSPIPNGAIPGQIGAGSSNNSWAACKLHVPAHQLPLDCVIFKAGFVCWQGADGTHSVSSSLPVRFFVGHLSVTAAVDTVHSQPISQRVQHLRAFQPVYYPLPPPQLQPTISSTHPVDVEMGVPSVSVPSVSVPSVSVLSVCVQAPAHSWAASEAAGVGAQHSGQDTSSSAVLQQELGMSCDLCWEVERSITGQAVHSVYHIWGRLLSEAQEPAATLSVLETRISPASAQQPQVMPAAGTTTIRASASASAPDTTLYQGTYGAAAPAASASTANGSKVVEATSSTPPPASPTDALGSSPTVLQYNSWTWLGCTVASCYAVRASLMAACAQIAQARAQKQGKDVPDTRSVLVQLAVQPAQAADGLVVGQIEDCASILIRVPLALA